MVKVVLDTNVVVSAALNKKGLPALLVSRAIARKIDLYYSPALIQEYREVLGREKFQLPPDQVDALIADLQQAGTQVHPVQTLTVLTRDPQDNRILECAQQAQADYLITGNKRHFPLARFDNIHIVNPREFIVQQGAELV